MGNLPRIGNVQRYGKINAGRPAATSLKDGGHGRYKPAMNPHILKDYLNKAMTLICRKPF